MNALQLMASGRLGVPVATSKSDQPVLIDTSGHIMCMHGERAPSIQAWLNAERADASFQRPSVCTCQNLDGLLTDYKHATAPALPSENISLFKLLGTLQAQEVVNNGRPQRLAIETPSSQIWIQPTGTIVCRHGNTRKVLCKIAKDGQARHRRNGVTKCDCSISIPRRVGSVFAKMNSGELKA